MNDNFQNKKILIISYYFPPSTQVGGKRFAFLSQLLVKKYPELHVLTVKKKYISPRDDFMPFGGTVHRTGVYPHYPTFKDNLFIRAFLRLWKDYFCLLDFASGWIFPALIILPKKRSCPPGCAGSGKKLKDSSAMPILRKNKCR